METSLLNLAAGLKKTGYFGGSLSFIAPDGTMILVSFSSITDQALSQ
jgi:hypothetical protein